MHHTASPVQSSRVESRRVGRSLMTRFDNLAWAVVAWVLTRSNWLIGIACCRHCYFSLEYCTLMFETALRFTRINNKWNEWMNEWMKMPYSFWRSRKSWNKLLYNISRLKISRFGYNMIHFIYAYSLPENNNWSNYVNNKKGISVKTYRPVVDRMM